MAIQTFDHTGFVVQDIPRAHAFYESVFGARPLHIANLKTRAYSGWPIISFVQMGLRRFELCLAQQDLPPADLARAVPRIGFAVPGERLAGLAERLSLKGIEVEAAPELPERLGISQCLRLRDPDGNVLELAAWSEQVEPSGDLDDVDVPVTDISHVALEVNDLDLAEKFYTSVLGLTLVHQDEGELGQGRIALLNRHGQLLLLERVEALSHRSMFCGPDASTAPEFPSRPFAGAHLALSVPDLDSYEAVESKLRDWGVATDGDVRAKERPAGERSEYFYDPAGNRMQLIVLAV